MRNSSRNVIGRSPSHSVSIQSNVPGGYSHLSACASMSDVVATRYVCVYICMCFGWLHYSPMHQLQTGSSAALVVCVQSEASHGVIHDRRKYRA